MKKITLVICTLILSVALLSPTYATIKLSSKTSIGKVLDGEKKCCSKDGQKDKSKCCDKSKKDGCKGGDKSKCSHDSKKCSGAANEKSSGTDKAKSTEKKAETK